MTTLLLNAFLVLLVILFGAMAYYPLFTKSVDTEAPVETYGEDIVVKVAPAPITQNHLRPVARAGQYSTRDDNGPEHPGHRPAA